MRKAYAPSVFFYAFNKLVKPNWIRLVLQKGNQPT